MTFQDWRVQFYVLVRCGWILLIPQRAAHLYVGPLDGGRWMERDATDGDGWLTNPAWTLMADGLAGLAEPFQRDARATLEACCCHQTQSGPCDFCAGRASAQDWIAKAGPRPRPGEAVRLTMDYGDLPAGSLGIIDGTVGEITDEIQVCFNFRAFRGRNSLYEADQRVFVSCSGGPAFFLPAACLHPRTEAVDVPFWCWQDASEADNGVWYSLVVPVWGWDGSHPQAFPYPRRQKNPLSEEP